MTSNANLPPVQAECGEKLKYALIGCGRIAPNHLAAVLALSDRLELVALCDTVEGNMHSLVAEMPPAHKERIRFYRSHEELLAKEKVDLATVATSSGAHAAIGLDCLQAGCHLIVEKPIALSMSDARALIHEADLRGRVLSACHQNRFNKSIVKIREAVQDGRFGKLLHGTAHVRWRRDRGYYMQAPWRGTWEEDGGALMNQCIHNIDLLRWMMGDEIEEVFAYTDNLTHGYIAGEDLGMALIRFCNGSYGIIEGTVNVYPQNLEETLYLFGQNGTVKAGGKSVNIIEEWSFSDGKDNPAQVKAQYRENPPNVYGYGHTPLYADVVDAIRSGRRPMVSGEDGLRALELVLAIYKSSLERRPVKLPLEEFSTMDMISIFGGREA